MNKIFPSLCLLLLAAVLCLHQTLANETPSPSVAPEPEDLIAQACDRTLYKNVCKAILESDPESEGSDFQDLGKIALQFASKNATAIFELVLDLSNSTTNEFERQCLADCSEGFQDVIEQVRDSIEALQSKRYNDANTWITAAMTDAQSCEEGFHEEPGHDSPLTEMNELFSQICSIALTITNLLDDAAAATA
ncbi:pectinesterase inhibitor-like [Tripterygium wilfordii]|uniref:Pectinesterase inhibitor-like n=1 Tax=Tripterygium wilfordii TaxID=458696 RepID=A0A7J7D1D6_TRIWF|nr:pectinesterase 1-like [Tripterygium wilfordii]KAF5739886.1 pectinesterase inhibitor-like [Tripterygium wilfordii]